MLLAKVLLFKDFNISFVSLKMASSVAVPFLNPNWFPTGKLFVLKCSFSIIYKAVSRTLEKEVSSDMGL
jgi:hypothetical protein